MTVPHTRMSSARGKRSARVRTGPRRLYFSGHYDFVPAQSRDQFQPRVEGANLFGRGSSDIKSGLAAIDVAVNNAGYSLLGNFEELPAADIESLFDTNFWGVAYVMRAVLPVMRKQRSGRIINIRSVAGVVGLKHCGAYGVTKFAVEGLSLSVANEVEQFV